MVASRQELIDQIAIKENELKELKDLLISLNDKRVGQTIRIVCLDNVTNLMTNYAIKQGSDKPKMFWHGIINRSGDNPTSFMNRYGIMSGIAQDNALNKSTNVEMSDAWDTTIYCAGYIYEGSYANWIRTYSEVMKNKIEKIDRYGQIIYLYRPVFIVDEK